MANRSGSILGGLGTLLLVWAIPAWSACPDSIRYTTDFNTLGLGGLSSSANPSQDGWYAFLQTGGATAEIQDVVAHTGQALFLDAPLANPSGLQTIARRDLTPADLASCPVVVLSFEFLCTTSNLAATNIYNARVSVTGGPHPGYSIIEISLTSGNGTPKSLGVDVATVAFDPSVQNNVPVPLAVGQDLSWGDWHSVELMLDQAGDRLLQIGVDGQFQDLETWMPPRSNDAGVWRRGQLTEFMNAEIVPNDSPEETLDRVYVDNLEFKTLPPRETTATSLALLDVQAEPRNVHVSWYAPDAQNLLFTVYRRTAESDWVGVGQPRIDINNQIIFDDGEVTPGTRYGYRLLVQHHGNQEFLGEVWVSVPDETEAPRVVRLEQSRPNPFGSRTQLRYGLPDAGRVRLSVYDLQGRRVATVVNEVQAAGWRSVSWDSRGVTSGTYFARLESGEEVRTQKIVVAR